MLKKIGLFVGGTVLGYFIGTKLTSMYFEKVIDTEIESFKKAYDDEFGRTKTYVEKGLNRISEHLEHKKEEKETTGKNLYQEVVYNIEDGELTEDDIYGEQPPREHSMSAKENPYIITEDQCVEEFLDYDKIALDFYRLDKVLTDSDGEPMAYTDTIKLIGYEAFELLSVVKQDMIIYVRNEKLMTDFEIGTVNDSHAETVIEEAEYKKMTNASKVIPPKPMTPREAYDAKKKFEFPGEGSI